MGNLIFLSERRQKISVCKRPFRYVLTKICNNPRGKYGCGAETAKGDYLYAKGRMQDREFSTTYDLGRYRETSFVPEYSVKELVRNGNWITVEITARTFVPCVKIYAGENAELSDNYFDMDAGEIRIITIYSKEKDQELLYYSFIDEWDN